jgi:ferredoxin
MSCNLSREQSIDKNEIGMPCSICGYFNDIDANYCIKCGDKLSLRFFGFI